MSYVENSIVIIKIHIKLIKKTGVIIFQTSETYLIIPFPKKSIIKMFSFQYYVLQPKGRYYFNRR